LQELLDDMAGGELAQPVWQIDRQGPPFQGLNAFEFQHSSVFFGREDETVAIWTSLREQARRGCAFLLLSGASGSGKSSLARAGVLPAIVEHEIDERVLGWRRSIVIPGRVKGDLLTGLAEGLAAPEAIPELRSGPNWLKELVTAMGRDPELTVRHVVGPALARSNTKSGEVRLLLLVDQLEELFTEEHVTLEAREEFLHAIESLARCGFAWVLATVRSDFYHYCQTSPALVRTREGAGQIDILPPEPDALRRLIVEPARLAGLRFEEQDNHSLADVLLRDAVAHRELLPLLEYTLRELFEERTSAGLLTFAAYAKLGGVEGALARRAEQTFLKLPSEVQGALDSVLSALVSVSGDEKGSFVRRRIPCAELGIDPHASAFIHAFVEERLLTSDAGYAAASATITVAHEALIRVWPRAREWATRNAVVLQLCSRTVEPKVVVDDRKLSLSQRTDRE
jgi:hypothetical protein